MYIYIYRQTYIVGVNGMILVKCIRLPMSNNENAIICRVMILGSVMPVYILVYFQYVDRYIIFCTLGILAAT